MESPILTFAFLFFANLLLLKASSADHHHYDDFLECLTDQFQRSNSATDVIYTPQNSSSFASLLLSPNLRPQSTSLEKPNLILTPFHESEIQAAIYCSKKLSMQIRVRSGGHDYEGLSYTSETPFVIVDMRNFRSIHIDGHAKTAWVQVGATLGQLYYTLSRESRTLAVVAGMCPTVGVGGHFSGGGYSMMSRKHGVAADHIIDAKLINADGKILDRRTMGEDHFWAIRGGGGTSFGIVLEFKVALVTVPAKVTVFNVTRTSENATRVVHRWQYIADKLDENLSFKVMLSSVPTTENRTIAASFWTLYLGPIRDLLPLMEEKFPELGLVEQDCTEMSWIESTRFFAGLSNEPLDILLDRTPRGFHAPVYFKGKSDFVTKPIPVNGLRKIWKFLVEEDGSQLQLSPFGGAFNAITESETPFPHRSGNIFMIHYRVGWTKPDESEKHMEWIRRLYRYTARYVAKSPRAAYFNYRDLDLGKNNAGNYTSYKQASVWGRKYFKNNFAKLVRVKSNVDPFNFLRNEQSVPPL